MMPKVRVRRSVPIVRQNLCRKENLRTDDLVYCLNGRACDTVPCQKRGLEGSSMAAQIAALSLTLSEPDLGRFLPEIRRFPVLERQEEYALTNRWREHGDCDAANRLVTSHLRLVAKIAMGYRGYGLPIAEVISEGNVGLMQAVKRFEPEKGFRLATYA